MRVLMLSDHLSGGGGASIAATRLAAALAQVGAEVTRVVARPDREAGSEVRVMASSNTGLRMARGAVGRDRRHRLLRPLTEWKWSRLLDELRPDVVNVHNIHHGFEHGWSHEVVRQAARVAPVWWTLHDMWSFTGRCAYDAGCGLFRSQCDATCPTPREYPRLAPRFIRQEHLAKRSVLAQANVRAVAPSRWMAEQAIEGGWPDGAVEHVPNPIDLDVFNPRVREAGRRRPAGAHDRPTVLVVAQELHDRHKGMDLFLEAAPGFPDVDLVSMGHGRLAGVESLGYVASDERKAEHIAAADLLVVPSRADNLPVVVQEAMACGTPVVAFGVGGLPEMVVDGVSGVLVEQVAGAALQDGVCRALSTAPQLRVGARAQAEPWRSTTVGARYLELFRRGTRGAPA